MKGAISVLQYRLLYKHLKGTMRELGLSCFLYRNVKYAVIGNFTAVPTAHKVGYFKSLPSVLAFIIAFHYLNSLIINNRRVKPNAAVPTNGILLPIGCYAVKIYLKLRIACRGKQIKFCVNYLVADTEFRKIGNFE